MNYFENKWPALLLWPLSVLYHLVTSLRHASYSFGILKQHRLNIPVISIGNLTVGGTGKTPTVIYLTQWLHQRGLHACILSRGYGRKETKPMILANDRPRPTLAQVGDEPLLMAQHLPDTPIVVDADRVAAAKWAVQHLQPDVLLLDDGMQHRRLVRDCDIVTFRRSRPFGNGFLLPAGPLRESKRRLGSSSLFWFNGLSGVGTDLFPEIPRIYSRYQPMDMLDSTGTIHPLTAAATPVVAFCGLANPQAFRQTLTALGFHCRAFIAFSDHHDYTDHDISRLQSVYAQERPSFMITTEKDWVKICNRLPAEEIWRCLRIQIVPENARQVDALLARIFALPTNG